MTDPMERLTPSRTSINLIANYAGTGWTALMGLAFVPVFIRLLGIESFGLIGFFAALQAVLKVLDLGISPTVNRELARHTARSKEDIGDLVRSLEVVYWPVGVGLGVLLAGSSSWVAREWIQAQGLTTETVSSAVMAMAAVIALQWPVSFYWSGLMGLQRQALANAVSIVVATLRNAGAAVLLAFVSDTILVFFLWQAAVSALQVLVLAILLWRSLPASRGARLRFSLVRSSWRFAAGAAGITATGLLLTNLDKLVVSRMLDLESFGYYALAASVANGLSVLVTPFFGTLYPRFAELIASSQEEALRLLYHRGTQFLAAILMPAACILGLFAWEVIRVWTGDPDTAARSAPIASLLVLGTAVNGMMAIPYALQLAQGWTSLGLAINSALIALMVPLLIFLTQRFGAVGAASVWLIVSIGYMLLGVPLTHRRFLKGAASRWLVEDVGLPTAAAFGVAGLARALPAGSPGAIGTLVSLAGTSVATAAAAVLAGRETRRWANAAVRHLGAFGGRRER